MGSFSDPIADCFVQLNSGCLVRSIVYVAEAAFDVDADYMKPICTGLANLGALGRVSVDWRAVESSSVYLGPWCVAPWFVRFGLVRGWL